MTRSEIRTANSKCLIFSTGLNGSLIIFIQTYTVNYRNALDRLRVRMHIILLHILHDFYTIQHRKTTYREK